jgi:hypothetical protein
MLMLVSLYALKTTGPALPVGPPELPPLLEELPPELLLEPPLLDELPPLLELEPPLLLLLLPVPPGHVAPPGSQPAPQLTAWQW